MRLTCACRGEDCGSPAISLDGNPKPSRPFLSDLWCAALALVGSCMTLTEVDWLVGSGSLSVMHRSILMFGAAALVLALAIAGFYIGPKARGVCFKVSFGIAIAMLSFVMSKASYVASASKVADVVVSSCLLDPIEDSKTGSTSTSTICLARQDDGSVLGRVLVQFEGELESNRLYRIAGSIEPLRDGSWHRYLFMKGCVAVVSARAIICSVPKPFEPIAFLRTRLLDAISPGSSPARALIAGVICGRTTELSQTEAYSAFSLTGLSHLVAVSGSHLAYIAMLMEALLLMAGFPVRVRSAIVAMISGLYVVFTGCSPSAVRSFLMVGCSSLTLALHRRPHALSALALSCILLCGVNPKTSWDLGFQLSAMSVLFLNVFCGYIGWTFDRLGVPKMLSQQISMSLTAQWATVPLTVPVFGALSVISPVANVLVGPLMTALLAAGLVLVPLSLIDQLREIVMIPMEALANFSIFFATVLSKIPFGSVIAEGFAWLSPLLYGIAVAIYVMWPTIPRLGIALSGAFVGAAFACHIIRWTLFAPPSITVMDVGQGDSIVIREGAASLLVDAGVDDAALDALVRNNVAYLDGVVITHWDKDHWGGLPSIMQRIPIKRLFIAEGALDAMPSEIDVDAFEEIVQIAHGDTIGVGGFACDVIWPEGSVLGEENGDSVCLLVDYEKSDRSLRCLLTGDTELDQERSYQDEVGDIDVLKLGHHGSALSVDAKLLEALDPEVSIASAGRGNSYGHPAQECVDYVRGYGSQFYCTIDSGDVFIEPWWDAVKIKCSRSL